MIEREDIRIDELPGAHSLIAMRFVMDWKTNRTHFINP
jgi:hypothetical protein